MHVSSRSNDGPPPDGMRAALAVEAAGLARGWILSDAYHHPLDAEARAENDFVIAEAKKASGRLIPVASVSSRQPGAEAELHRAKAAGAKAVKLHSVSTGLDLTRPDDLAGFEALFAAAEREGLPILVHGSFSSDGEAKALVDLAERHPRTRIIIAHLLGKDLPLLATLKGRHIFVDVSGLPYLQTDAQRSGVVALIRAAGIRRFIFASDWPLFHPADTLLALERLPLTDGERAQILSENARAFDDLAH